MTQTTGLIGVNPCLTEGYLKKQNQNRPSAGNPKHETRNPKRVEGLRLKKQSQCQNGQNDINPAIAMIYGYFDDFGRFWSAKNKANRRASAGNPKH